MKSIIFPLTLFFILLSFATQAFAYDFYWSGNYSAQGNYFANVDLGNSSDGDKSYVNHHLFLQPEVILFSGLSVKGGLDIINGGSAGVPPSQRIGHILGGGLAPNSSTYNPDQPYAFLNRQLQRNRSLNINEAYLEYSHINGELLVGRFPLHFGFGAFYNEGHQAFDHWFTNRDGVAYNFSFGNLHFKPMVSFLTDSLDTSGGRVLEYGLEFHFKVEDTGLDLGVMLLQRSVSAEANAAASVDGVVSGSADPLFMSLFYKRQAKNYYYGFEGFVQSGDVGTNASGNSVSLKGLGIAAEGQFSLKQWDILAKAGYANGNDVTNEGSYSGVSFHRNYNLGLILFNHPLGSAQFDPTGTNSRGRLGSLNESDFLASSVADTDSISNTMYFSPTVGYNFSDAWKFESTLVMAWLQETNVLNSGDSVSSYLGSEIDLTLTYKPTENIISTTSVGFLLPGSAFEGNGQFDTSTAFGATTSLGITF